MKLAKHTIRYDTIRCRICLMNPCVYIYIYIYRISDPYIALYCTVLYCPSYDQIRKEREREGGREGVGEMFTEEA